MTYVFDIDNTICKTEGSDYDNSDPIQTRIEKINNLYEEGHVVIMMTARGMGRSNQNEIESYRLLYDYTYSQLVGWGLKFHKLLMGKPTADFYVDDKAINSEIFFK
jgi:capsule biosynthesis phosphatase